jgi:hypothetical protein
MTTEKNGLDLVVFTKARVRDYGRKFSATAANAVVMKFVLACMHAGFAVSAAIAFRISPVLSQGRPKTANGLFMIQNAVAGRSLRQGKQLGQGFMPVQAGRLTFHPKRGVIVVKLESSSPQVVGRNPAVRNSQRISHDQAMEGRG